MSVIEVTKMPKASTLRKYYPESKLSDDKLVEIAEWLKKYIKHQHISADNHILAALIAWEEYAEITGAN